MNCGGEQAQQEAGNAAQAETHHVIITISIVTVCYCDICESSFILSSIYSSFCVSLYLDICENTLLGIMHSLSPYPDLNLFLLTR